MSHETKYLMLTIESFPFNRKTKYVYLPLIPNISIGDVITDKSGRRYKIIAGKTQVPLSEIDTSKYELFELL